MEYFFLYASQSAKRLKYDIITETYEGEKEKVYTSNEFMGKTPLNFAATNFIDPYVLNEEEIESICFSSLKETIT